MAEKVDIGEKYFQTKKSAKEHFKAMLGRYQNHQTISGDDEEDLRYLLERHPEAESKIGCGVTRIYRAPTEMGTPCFWLEREDSSTTDFSYISCVDAKKKSLYQEFAEACRAAVQSDLHEAKVNHFKEHGDSENKVPCDLAGDRISWDESHLDHKKPKTFQIIVQSFIAAQDIEIKPEILSLAGDAQFTTTFMDKQIEARFKAYHHKFADLRIIKAKKNLSLGGSERITKAKRPVVIPNSTKKA